MFNNLLSLTENEFYNYFDFHYKPADSIHPEPINMLVEKILSCTVLSFHAYSTIMCSGRLTWNEAVILKRNLQADTCGS